MKRMLVFFLLLTIFTSHYQTIFAAFHEEEPPMEEILPRITEIFEVRTSIWNSFLDIPTDDLTKIEKKLKGYVEDPLLREDLKMYRQMLVDPTSFEKIMSFQIDECSWLQGTANHMKIYLNIEWEIMAYEEVVYESVNYIVEMRKNKDTWYLTDYKVYLDK